MAFEPHLSQHEAADAPQQNAAEHIDARDAPAERAGKHGHCHFIDQGRCDEIGEGDAQRYAALDETDEEGDGGAGAEGSDGTEKAGKQILQPIEPMARQEMAQPLYGEVGIDDAHRRADEEEKEQDFQRVIDEEVQGFAQARGSFEAAGLIDEPVGKVLYHGV